MGSTDFLFSSCISLLRMAAELGFLVAVEAIWLVGCGLDLFCSLQLCTSSLSFPIFRLTCCLDPFISSFGCGGGPTLLFYSGTLVSGENNTFVRFSSWDFRWTWLIFDAGDFSSVRLQWTCWWRFSNLPFCFLRLG